MRTSLRALVPSALLVTGLMLGAGASAVDAQGESPAPDPLAALAGTDFAGVFPTELGGLPWDDITVQAGAETIEGQNEEERAKAVALLEVLGATVDDVTTATASKVSEDFSEFTVIFAVKVSGVDANRLLEGILPTFADDLELPRREDGQVAGKDVVLLLDDADPDADAVYLYASGETVWLVSALEPDLTEAFEKLP